MFAAGIDAGDRVTFDTPFQTLPHNRVMGKAFDDRLGCYLLIALLRELHQTPLDCELWLVASSSEEVGLRGGQTATRAIHPDIALVLDTACWSMKFRLWQRQPSPDRCGPDAGAVRQNAHRPSQTDCAG